MIITDGHLIKSIKPEGLYDSFNQILNLIINPMKVKERYHITFVFIFFSTIVPTIKILPYFHDTHPPVPPQFTSFDHLLTFQICRLSNTTLADEKSDIVEQALLRLCADDGIFKKMKRNFACSFFLDKDTE